MSPARGLTLYEIRKSFAEKAALNGVSFEVQPGEVVALLGPSGCGKSTLLAIIAGLEHMDAGQALWEGVSLQDTPPHRRDFGLMFQDFALFPHRNVFKNIAFGLEMKRFSDAEIEQRVSETLNLVGLPGFGPRDVNTLSGGEAQRVALARSLAPRPRLLMLDEPLGSLDRTLRERLALDLRHILRASHQTAIYVTHDQEEAFVIADRVVVMNVGQVEQVGAPSEIYLQPASVFVARFLGMNNLLEGEMIFSPQGVVVRTEIGDLAPRPPLAPKVAGPPPAKVWALLRPDAGRIEAANGKRLVGLVKEKEFRGSMVRVTITTGKRDLTFDFSSGINLPGSGEQIELTLDPDSAVQILHR